MKLFLENGCTSLRNLGDISMLAVGLRRWRELFPEAEILVPTEDADQLRELDKRAIPQPAEGQVAWFAQPLFGYRFERLMQVSPEGIRNQWTFFDWRMRVENPERVKNNLERQGRKRDAQRLSELIDGIQQSDAVVSMGGGFITDTFSSTLRYVMAGLYLAGRSGKPRALFGQGLGPLKNSGLVRCARHGLRGIQALGLRERLYGEPLAQTLGVPNDIIHVTGDDAIELARNVRPLSEPQGDLIGLNIRLADYAKVSEDSINRLRIALRRLRSAVGGSWLALPVSHFKHRGGASEDSDGIRSLIGENSGGDCGESVSTPEMLAERVSDCRMVISGSYHAGVFALSRGIPVIGLYQAPYYESKFKGLADMFGCGCFPVKMDSPDFESLFLEAGKTAWNWPASKRNELLSAGDRQLKAGRELYSKFAANILKTTK